VHRKVNLTSFMGWVGSMKLISGSAGEMQGEHWKVWKDRTNKYAI
jgi:hypothetical protein